MTLLNYIKKHDWRYPFGSQEDTDRVIHSFRLCENKEEIEWYKNLITEEEGMEEWELFKDYCMETGKLPHIFTTEEK